MTHDRGKHYNQESRYIDFRNDQHYKMMRRHKANVFEALFYDKEPLSETVISKIVEQAAAFFDLPMPLMTSGCGCLPYIEFDHNTETGSEIHFDISYLNSIGINNPDAFEELITHEISHLFVATRMRWINHCDTWTAELACDFLTGIRCEVENMASGKYKFAIGLKRTSESHPSGDLRIAAFKSGYEYAQWLRKKGCNANASNSLPGIRRFICLNASAISNLHKSSLEQLKSEHPRPRNIMDYSDSNLIKQYLIKNGIYTRTNDEN